MGYGKYFKNVLIAGLYFFIFMSPLQVHSSDHALHNDTDKHEAHLKHQDEKKADEGEHDHLKLSSKIIKQANIELLKAGKKTLQIKRDIIGKIVPNADNTYRVYPRYPGLIKQLSKKLGEPVTKGEVLAVIESNDTLQQYKIIATASGTIVKKMANVGEQLTLQTPIYQVSDLSTVWCDLFIYRKDARDIRIGQAVTIHSDNAKRPAVRTKIAYVSPLGIEHNQTMLARVVLANKKQQWLPGLYVDASLVVKEKPVELAIRLDALHEIEGQASIFIRSSEGFRLKHCQLIQTGQQYVEVAGCLLPGDIYAAKNSYLLKAHLGKESAEHQH